MNPSLRVLWDWPAKAAFFKLPTHTATIVDRAVVRFAETGDGDVEWVAPHYRLRAGFYDVLINIDFEQGALTVLSIYRARA